MEIHKLITLLSSARLPVDTEKDTQRAIEELFIKNKVNYEREFFLDKNNVPDFFIEGVVIEVKIKGNRKGITKNILKQCERYCQFEQVSKLILVTNRNIGFPTEINYRPCYVVNISRS